MEFQSIKIGTLLSAYAEANGEFSVAAAEAVSLHLDTADGARFIKEHTEDQNVIHRSQVEVGPPDGK